MTALPWRPDAFWTSYMPVDDAQVYYFDAVGDSGTSALTRMPLLGGHSATPPLGMTTGPYALDATSLYWAAGDGVWKCPKGGSCDSPTYLGGPGNHPGLLAIDADQLGRQVVTYPPVRDGRGPLDATCSATGATFSYSLCDWRYVQLLAALQACEVMCSRIVGLPYSSGDAATRGVARFVARHRRSFVRGDGISMRWGEICTRG